MTPGIVSLLAMTIGFSALVVWVYWPSRKADVERHGRIPFADGPLTNADGHPIAQPNSQKEGST